MCLVGKMCRICSIRQYDGRQNCMRQNGTRPNNVTPTHMYIRIKVRNAEWEEACFCR
jgi:hypothetical protein